MAGKTSTGLLRKRLFLALVRHRTVEALQAKGKSPQEARELVNHLQDETILEMADKKKVKGPLDGGFLDWIKSHLDTLGPLIELLVTILAAFATDNPATGTTPAP